MDLGLVRERLKDQPACWVSGHFDPLLAEHVRLLAGSRVPGQVLVVEVTDGPKPLLARRARAELVAALSMVDYVVLSPNGADAQAEDSKFTDRFVRHVIKRHAR
jgi:bifunctional ADP-heptose synthase (sugar kinase/adenylyltransferase)